jgi:hypothetical protein
MGVDLRLIPLMYDSDGRSAAYPHVVLELDRERSLWDHVRDHLKVEPLGRELYDHRDDEGLVRGTEDSYGCALTYATAYDLDDLFQAWLRRPLTPPESRSGSWTRAAAAYVAELPNETKVVLWWH